MYDYKNNVRPEDMERITTIELANKFIDEQVEEEESARDMITALEAVEGNKYGLYMLDKEQAARAYVAPSPLAAE